MYKHIYVCIHIYIYIVLVLFGSAFPVVATWLDGGSGDGGGWRWGRPGLVAARAVLERGRAFPRERRSAAALPWGSSSSGRDGGALRRLLWEERRTERGWKDASGPRPRSALLPPSSPPAAARGAFGHRQPHFPGAGYRVGEIPLPLPREPVSEPVFVHRRVPGSGGCGMGPGEGEASGELAAGSVPGSPQQLQAVGKGISQLSEPGTSPRSIGRSPKACVCPWFRRDVVPAVFITRDAVGLAGDEF